MKRLNPEQKQVIPQAGTMLISEPFLPDDNFKRTVIMLCEHNDEGSIGFILNKPLGMMINEAVEDFPEFQVPLYLGGPVEHNTLHYLHRLGDQIEGSHELLNGLWWGGNFEHLKAEIDNGNVAPEDVRFFLGYSGWGKGQLEDELNQKSWVVANGKASYIFDTEPDDLWTEVLQNMGGQYQLMSTFPESPLLN
jgi:putative transcriptional regulator